jgi:DNA-binding PadR family transcriptional regulator
MKSCGRKLSELEGVSLGIIYKQQPCTAYQVRGELKMAPSSHWRASAGTVYPLLARLEDEDLVVTTADENDGRGRKLLSLTAEGRESLRRWVVSGADQELISSATDPIRSRAFFLDVLGSAKQLTYLGKLIVQMEHYLSETRAHLDRASETDDIYDQLGALGAVKISEARLDWLRLVYERLSSR